MNELFMFFSHYGCQSQIICFCVTLSMMSDMFLLFISPLHSVGDSNAHFIIHNLNLMRVYIGFWNYETTCNGEHRRGGGDFEEGDDPPPS